ncbi:uncharacterized protein H6S33_004030 [Morchella sextelata]|uniref:uncharacterized protein n=1 Tax=Morchella sextelata TaxID=1174677 RepID=UPI001D04D2B1|nr:uncharacterized protein H6S33_004030 [Morchella sextelata]KAH0606369.1 hypothetical protein H6S33_004030 [Morchella sextelata]
MSDTDSDVGDANSIISTSVLLGYAEENPTEDPISQLGGTPKWMHPASPADSRLAKCSNCNKLMSLLLQLNGDIPETPHERVFYVWACRHKPCWRKKGSLRAFRGVRIVRTPAPAETDKKKTDASPPPPAEKKKEPVNTGAFLFGSGPAAGSANPFAQGGVNPFAPPSSTSSTPANPFSTTTANPFSTATATPSPPPAAPNPKPSPLKTFASALSHNLPPAAPQPTPQFYGPPEPWPSPLPHTYPSYHLDAEHEHLDTRTPALPKNVQIVDTDEYADTPMSNSAEGGESSVDKTFRKFADRVEQNPEQVLRYERKGTPLLYSKDDETGKLLLAADGEVSMKRVPPCSACRKQRVFEFQLMPFAISMLERDEAGLDGMEWGTIIVATCVCVPAVLDAQGVGYVEEWVGAQWESTK